MYKLQQRFDAAGMSNVSTTSNAKIGSVFDGYSQKLIDDMSRFDEHVTHNLPKYLSYSNTQTGSFLQFFSQQTHEPYVWRDANDRVHSSSDQNHFFDAMYTALKETQAILTKLKAEPYY